MRSLRDSNGRQSIIARIERLSIDNQRQWGKMGSRQMLAHVADQLRMALRDLDVSAPHGPYRFAPMRFLVVHAMPWPKGRAQGPEEAFTTDPGEWEADRQALLELVDRFATAEPNELAPLHPLFGPMTVRDWDVLSYRHLDHHLRQFDG